jgi:hypothetical protein
LTSCPTGESMELAADWIARHTPAHPPVETEVIKGHTMISASC